MSEENLVEKESTQKATAIMLSFSLLAFAYTCAIVLGLNEKINFFPSHEWRQVAIAPSLILGILSGVFATPIYAYIFKSEDVRQSELYKEDTFKIKINISAFISALIFSWLFYILLLFGVGPLLTCFDFTTVQKDIAGAKVHIGGREPSYFIKTNDLEEGPFTNVYISYSEFKSISPLVRMRITFKQSFFGMTVKQYSFLNDNESHSQ
jgi:hypothetical protein